MQKVNLQQEMSSRSAAVNLKTLIKRQLNGYQAVIITSRQLVSPRSSSVARHSHRSCSTLDSGRASEVVNELSGSLVWMRGQGGRRSCRWAWGSAERRATEGTMRGGWGLAPGIHPSCHSDPRTLHCAKHCSNTVIWTKNIGLSFLLPLF